MIKLAAILILFTQLSYAGDDGQDQADKEAFLEKQAKAEAYFRQVESNLEKSAKESEERMKKLMSSLPIPLQK